MSRRTRRDKEDHHHSSSKRRKTSDDEEAMEDENLYDLRHDLSRFLDEHYNVTNVEDFWRFYMKYESGQKKKNPTIDEKIFNTNYRLDTKTLYEKLPLYSSRGNRLKITFKSFDTLHQCITTYLNFLQRQRFQKFESLRKSQRELPINRYKADILRALDETNVVLIAGDTGCGKSTQVPQYVSEKGYKFIACTQPRRIACVSLANRVAQETLTVYRNKIGYQVRFERNKFKDTNVVFLTEGILLRQANEEEVINRYDVIILDEVHERHLNVDFLVGIMKCLLRQRNFKLILMSATINLKLFQEYFQSEHVKTVCVPGRLYPIEIVYKPILKDAYESNKKRSRFDCQPYLHILELIDSKYKPHEKGDALIFLNGLFEIQRLTECVQEYASQNNNNWIVLQLHSSLSMEDQEKVFHQAPEGARKCIVSTNIAETSVTIDGVRFVIDSGKVNRMRYESSCVNKLFETDISQDSAKQRAGRAGRTGPGICYRLYDESSLAKFEPFTPAEIHLVPLENLVLNMIVLGLSDIKQFPFLERPSDESLRQALRKLGFLEAIKEVDGQLTLTTLGEAINRLPVDLTIGKMLITSTVFSSAINSATMASLISVQNILNENQTFELRKDHESNHGEPITLLNLYREWLEVKMTNRENSRKWCRKRGIEEQRFYEITKLVEQFRTILQDADLIPKQNENLTAREKSIRNGELKQLKSLRRNLKVESKNKTRTVLKKQNLHLDNDEDDDEKDHLDIRDVEFRIVNDLQKLSTLMVGSNTESRTDIFLHKIILTSALYPQVAVEDEFNASKTVNDRLWHTKYKNYVFLRPTSFFCTNPEFFALSDSDIEVPPSGYFSKKPLSTKHQILIYQKLLETRKIYIMNTFRMPALETLLLFGQKICTNRTFTKMAVDDFLYIESPFLWFGKELLLKSLKIRKLIKGKINENLNNKEFLMSEREKYELIEKVADFITRNNVPYNIKRLLPADIKNLYQEPEDYQMFKSVNPFDADFAVKNGQVTENLFYDHLPCDMYDIQAESSLMELKRCQKCREEIQVMTMYELLLHEAKCTEEQMRKDEEKKNKEEPETSQSGQKTKKFTCTKCEKIINATPVEFLKHRKYCAPVKTEKI